MTDEDGPEWKDERTEPAREAEGAEGVSGGRRRGRSQQWRTSATNRRRLGDAQGSGSEVEAPWSRLEVPSLVGKFFNSNLQFVRSDKLNSEALS